MTVLRQSPPGTLREVVRGQKIVQELQKWLQSAAESKDLRLAFRVMESLEKLPIDLTVLQVGLAELLSSLSGVLLWRAVSFLIPLGQNEVISVPRLKDLSFRVLTQWSEVLDFVDVFKWLTCCLV